MRGLWKSIGVTSRGGERSRGSLLIQIATQTSHSPKSRLRWFWSGLSKLRRNGSCEILLHDRPAGLSARMDSLRVQLLERDMHSEDERRDQAEIHRGHGPSL